MNDTGFFSLAGKSGYSAARHRGAEGADARHVAVAPRLALLQEQAARLGGAIPVMTIGQTGDVIFQLAQSFGTDAPVVGKVKQAADKIWTLKIEKRAAVNPAAEVETEWNDETTLRHRDGEPRSGLLGVSHEVLGG